jgi:hypothetical protein
MITECIGFPQDGSKKTTLMNLFKPPILTDLREVKIALFMHSDESPPIWDLLLNSHAKCLHLESMCTLDVNEMIAFLQQIPAKTLENNFKLREISFHGRMQKKTHIKNRS